MDMIWKKNVPRRGKGLSGNKFGMSEGQQESTVAEPWNFFCEYWKMIKRF